MLEEQTALLARTVRPFESGLLLGLAVVELRLALAEIHAHLAFHTQASWNCQSGYHRH